MSPKFKRWLLIGFGLMVLVLLYLVHEVLLPFVLSGVFVYLLAPAVDFLSSKSIGKFKLSRGFSVVLVFIGFLTGIALLVLIVLPPVYQEVLKIANDIPAQIERFRLVTLPNWTHRLEALSTRYNLDINVEAFIEQTLEQLYQSARLQVEALPENMRKIVEVLFSTLSSFLVIFIATQRDAIGAPQCLSTLQLHNWNEDYEDRVVAISEQGRYIAIGDSDLPLHIWDGQTGERCYACLSSLDHEGTEVVINCYSTK